MSSPPMLEIRERSDHLELVMSYLPSSEKEDQRTQSDYIIRMKAWASAQHHWPLAVDRAIYHVEKKQMHRPMQPPVHLTMVYGHIPMADKDKLRTAPMKNLLQNKQVVSAEEIRYILDALR